MRFNYARKNKFQKTLLYVSDEGEVSLDVIVDQEGETFWATQKQWLKCLV